MSVSLDPTQLRRPLETADGQADASRNPERIREAAGEFEGLLLAQLLKSARESSSEGCLDGQSDEAGSTAMGMAEEMFARCIGSRGGLGLADLISRQLSPPAQAMGEAKVEGTTGTAAPSGHS